MTKVRQEGDPFDKRRIQGVYPVSPEVLPKSSPPAGQGDCQPVVWGSETISIRPDPHRTEGLGKGTSFSAESGGDPGLSWKDPALDRLPEDRPA